MDARREVGYSHAIFIYIRPCNFLFETLLYWKRCKAMLHVHADVKRAINNEQNEGLVEK